MSRRTTVFVLALFAPLVVSTASLGAETWIGTWAAAARGNFTDAQISKLRESLPGRKFATPEEFSGTSRSRIRIAKGGHALRLTLSNVFGTQPLAVEAATVVIATDGMDAMSSTVHELRFGGQERIVIPPGALVISDDVILDVSDGADLVASAYIPNGMKISVAPGGAASSNATMLTDAVAADDATKAAHFHVGKLITNPSIFTQIDVLAPHDRKVVVALGDSITDGVVASNGDRGWPGALARRLATKNASVVNAGIGGNRLLRPTGTQQECALARLDRDVFSVPGITHIVLLEGINDIRMSSGDVDALSGDGPVVRTDELIAAYKQIVTRAHARGIKVIGATMLPFGGAVYFTPEKESVREAVNDWIRTSKAFDAVIDFDLVTHDPAAATRLSAVFDSGDHLHPGPVGYKAMAEAINLDLFK